MSNQLRLLSKVKAYLPPHDFERVIHAFMPSHLDYCNFCMLDLIIHCFTACKLLKMQPTGLLTGKKRRNHITAVLVSIHWPPVFIFGSNSKVYHLFLRVLSYLSELFYLLTPGRALRSTNQIPGFWLKSRLENPNQWNRQLFT